MQKFKELSSTLDEAKFTSGQQTLISELSGGAKVTRYRDNRYIIDGGAVTKPRVVNTKSMTALIANGMLNSTPGQYGELFTLKNAGLTEGIDEAVNTRDAISNVLGMMGFGGVKVPQATYDDKNGLESWSLAMKLTPSEMKHFQSEILKANKTRFVGANVTTKGGDVVLSVTL